MSNTITAISKYNLTELKNTSDDTIPNYLNSIHFAQSHFLTDVRLGLGYTAFFVGAACFGWDYKFGWDATKHYTAAAVAIYALLNGLLSLWIWFVEKGVVYEGTAPTGEKISIATTVAKNDPVYNLKVTLTPKSGASVTRAFAYPFNRWFDETGWINTERFQEIFHSNIPLIGQLHAKYVTKDASAQPAGEAQAEEREYSPEMLNALLAASSSASAAGSATGTEAAAKKGGKRRKA